MIDVVVLEHGRARATMTTQLGEWMGARRRAVGLTQDELAEKAGVSQALVSGIETGIRKWPSREIRQRLAAALGVSHLELLIGAGELDPDEIADASARVNQETMELQALLAELTPDQRASVFVLIDGFVSRNRGRAT